MTDEEAAEIEATWHKFRRVELYRGDPDSERKLADALLNHIPALLAERAALLEIVRAVAALKDEFYGKTIDDVKIGGWAFATEDVTPLVEQARALLTGDDD